MSARNIVLSILMAIALAVMVGVMALVDEVGRHLRDLT